MVALDPKEVGKRIKAARNARGWSQFQFAVEAAVSLSTVTKWESGKLPPVRELMRIADVLGVPVCDLVDPVDEPYSVSQRLSRLESGDAAMWDFLQEIAAALGVPARERPPTDSEPAI